MARLIQLRVPRSAFCRHRFILCPCPLRRRPERRSLPIRYNQKRIMNKMIFANLVHRPFRTIISVVAIAVEVTLILLIVGLSIGMLNDAKNRQAGIGADIMVQPPNSSLLMGVNVAPVSIKLADRLRKVDHVVAVAPVVAQLNTAGSVEVIDGIDLQSFEAVGGPMRYLAG